MQSVIVLINTRTMMKALSIFLQALPARYTDTFNITVFSYILTIGEQTNNIVLQ